MKQKITKEVGSHSEPNVKLLCGSLALGLLLPILVAPNEYVTPQYLFTCLCGIIGALSPFVIFYLCSPVAIDARKRTLNIIKGAHIIGTTVIYIEDIKEIHVPAPTQFLFSPRSPTSFGTNGLLFGYFGKFHNNNYGYFTTYVGDRSKAFYVILKRRKKYLLSCNDREAMLKNLAKKGITIKGWHQAQEPNTTTSLEQQE